MLEIKNGYKSYNGHLVLEDINLRFENNHIYGLVGINGSGKTLILKALSGYLKLDKGVVRQNNIIIRQRHNYIKDAGILIENPTFISHLSLLENLKIIKNMCPNKSQIRLEDWIELYQIQQFIHTPYRNLSLGTKKKMALIQAFIHSPSILILDEPMNALDTTSVTVTKELIRAQQEKGLVILTSHHSSDIDELCDYVYHVAEGRIQSI